MVQWFVGLSIFSIPIAMFIGRRSSWLIGFGFSYVTIWSLLSVLFFKGRSDFALSGGITYISLAVSMISVCSMKTNSLVKLVGCLPWYGFINSVYVISGWVFGFGVGELALDAGISGVIDYSGLNGILIVMSTAPLAFRMVADRTYTDYAVLIACCVAVVLSKSSIPYGVACSIAVGYILCGRGKWVCVTAASVCILFAGVGLMFEGGHLFDSGQRFQAYFIFMSEWWERGLQVFGAGPGSFTILSSAIQKKHLFMYDPSTGNRFHWPWIHSDVIQVVFEYGLTGAIIMVGALSQILRRLYRAKERELFALVCGVVGASVFDYGFRYFPLAIVFSSILILATRRPTDNTQNQ